jgi:predicted CoA-substrate-specific enzyme activase
VKRDAAELIHAGCDLGIASAKAVVVRDGEVLAAEVLPYRSLPHAAAAEVMEKAATRAGLSAGDVDRWVATGFAGKVVPRAFDVAPIKMCLHRALRELNPRVRTVIDVGGHSLTAFNIDGGGRMGASSITDACAAGTGRFIEAMAGLLETPLEEFSSAALRSTSPARITGQCVVLAESDVISHINDGVEPDDIIAGIALAVADKIAGMVRRIDVDEEVALVGGVAKNAAVVRYLEDELRLRLAALGGMDPQLLGAFGAALMAGESRPRPS